MREVDDVFTESRVFLVTKTKTSGSRNKVERGREDVEIVRMALVPVNLRALARA